MKLSQSKQKKLDWQRKKTCRLQYYPNDGSIDLGKIKKVKISNMVLSRVLYPDFTMRSEEKITLKIQTGLLQRSHEWRNNP